MKLSLKMKSRYFSIPFTAKLSLGFALVLLLFAAVSAFTALRLETLRSQDAELQALAERQRAALELRSVVERMDSLATGYLLTGKPELAERYWETSETFFGLVRAVGDAAQTPEQRNWRARLSAVAAEFTANFERAAEVREKPAAAAAAYNASQIHKQVIFELVDSFADAYTSAETAEREGYSALIAGIAAVAIWSNGVAALCAAAVAIPLVRSLSAGVRRLRTGIDRMHAGDLTEIGRSRTRDELGRLGNRFADSVASVRGMLAETRRIASELQGRSRQFRRFAASTREANHTLVRAMEDIASGAVLQAEQAEAGVRALNELERRMLEIGSAAERLLAESRRAGEAVRGGTDTVAALGSSAERTGEAMQAMSEALRRLERQTAEVTGVTAAIRELSQQTNVLALNASIEAARAGEHGRGFSVIAERIRQLSFETTEASARAGRLLDPLRAGAADTAAALSAAAGRFSEQRNNVSQAGEAFLALTRSFQAFDEDIKRIGERTSEAQKCGALLSEAVSVIAAVAQQAAAGVQETAATNAEQDRAIESIAAGAGELQRLAEALARDLGRFMLESAADPDISMSKIVSGRAE